MILLLYLLRKLMLDEFIDCLFTTVGKNMYCVHHFHHFNGTQIASESMYIQIVIVCR